MPLTRNAYYLLVGMAAILVLWAEFAAETLLRQHLLREERNAAAETLTQLRTRIEKVIYRDLSAAQAMAAYIGIHPDLDQAEFSRYAAALMGSGSTLRHLAAAPDMIIRYVHPMAGNESILGIDYRKVPRQSAVALRTLESSTMVVAGPVELVQGGNGIIGRYPVIVPDGTGNGRSGRPWGVASAVVDRDTFFHAVGLDGPSLPLRIALRGRDATGADGEVFFGAASLFDADPVTTTVGLPSGSWQLAARPQGGWLADVSGAVWGVRAAGLALIAMLVLLVAARSIHQRSALRAEQAVRRSEANFRLLFDNANDAIFINRADTLQIVDFNHQAPRYLGYTREALLKLRADEVYAGTEGSALLRMREIIATKGSAIFESEHRRADGSVVPVEISSNVVRHPDGDLIISVVRDISERKSIQAALRRTQQDLVNAIESIDEGFALWDEHDCLKIFNARFVEIFAGVRSAIRLGANFEAIMRASANQHLVHTSKETEAWANERLQQHRSGDSLIEVELQDGRSLRISEQGTPDGYTVGIYTDVTEVRQAERAIRHRAFYDALTELPNRENFTSLLATTVRTGQRQGTKSAVMFIDLDRFKNINDTMGHETGDLLLREAAQRICACVRQSDTVARFGGDEFTVILRDIDDVLNAARIAETIIASLAREYRLGGHVFYAGASIGITVCPDDTDDPQVLLRNADMAMYQAKARGRNTFQFFTSAMTAQAERFVAIEKDLRHSIGTPEFSLHYQPLIRLSDGALGGAEALLRWQHPVRGNVSPAEFIPVAEETRLIVNLGGWVLREACRQAAPWCSGAGATLPRLSVNVSSRQFWGGFNVDFVRAIVEETGFPPDRLVFEMTESLLIENDDRILTTLADFRALGIGIAVDDFGTGYSALSYLRRFPVTILKIDRAFVNDIEHDANDAHLVESIVAMARALRITVVAEGVESAGQAAMLRNMGCEFAQGYLFSRPLPAAAFAAQVLDTESTVIDRQAGGQ